MCVWYVWFVLLHVVILLFQLGEKIVFVLEALLFEYRWIHKGKIKMY